MTWTSFPIRNTGVMMFIKAVVGLKTDGQTEVNNNNNEEEECAGRDRQKMMEVWTFIAWSKQIWALAWPRIWQEHWACNACPDTKLSPPAVIHLLQSFQLSSPRLLNRPQTHLKVRTTVINFYMDVSSRGLSPSPFPVLCSHKPSVLSVWF